MTDNWEQVGVVSTHERIVITDAGSIPDFGFEGLDPKRLASAHEVMDRSDSDHVQTFCLGLSGVLLKARAGDDMLAYAVQARPDADGEITEIRINLQDPRPEPMR